MKSRIIIERGEMQNSLLKENQIGRIPLELKENNKKLNVNKIVVYYLFMMLCWSSCDNHHSKQNDEIVAKMSLVIFRSSNIQPITIQNDSSGLTNFYIRTNYEFTNRSWEYLIMAEIITELRKKRHDFERDSMLFQIEYGGFVEDNIAVYRINSDVRLPEFEELVLFDTIADYVVNELSPGDFSAYDSALSNDIDSDYSTFLDFLYQIAGDKEQSIDEERILSELIHWANSRSDLETADHFIWLGNLIPHKSSEELELDLSNDD